MNLSIYIDTTKACNIIPKEDQNNKRNYKKEKKFDFKYSFCLNIKFHKFFPFLVLNQ